MKNINVKAEKDYLERFLKTSYLDGLMELIWNGLDADATEIRLNYENDAFGNITHLEIIDNGHGIDYQNAQDSFSKLGGSKKKKQKKSPENRDYHGMLGRGRFKALCLGTYLTFHSVYFDEKSKSYKQFSIDINQEQLNYFSVKDLQDVEDTNVKTGVKVEITNIIPKIRNLFEEEYILKMESNIAQYYSKYPNFKIFINEMELDFFNQLKQDNPPIENTFTINGIKYHLKTNIYEWKTKNSKAFKKTYHFCNSEGIAFENEPLKYKVSDEKPDLPITIHLLTDFFDELDLNFYKPYAINAILKIAEKNLNNYLAKRAPYLQKELIEQLKEDALYPFGDEPVSFTQKFVRSNFDKLTIIINQDFIELTNPEHRTQAKVLLNYLKIALEKNEPEDFIRVFKEVSNLSKSKFNTLVELLNITTLSGIIETSFEISRRIKFVKFLKGVLFENSEFKRVFNDRKNLNNELLNNTWIFDEGYNIGINNERNLNQLISSSNKKLIGINLKEQVSDKLLVEQLLRIFIRQDWEEKIKVIENYLKENKKDFGLKNIYNNENRRKFAAQLIKLSSKQEQKQFITKIIGNSDNELYYHDLLLLKEDKTKIRYLKEIIKYSQEDDIEQKNVLKEKLLKNKAKKKLLEFCGDNDSNYILIKELVRLFNANGFKKFQEYIIEIKRNPIISTLISEILNLNNNNKLKELVPDFCICKQIPGMYLDTNENLIIEILKPNTIITINELNYLKSIVDKMLKNIPEAFLNDTFTFILVGENFDEALFGFDEYKIQREEMVFDDYNNNQNVKLIIKKWERIIDVANRRMQYLDEKLDKERSLSENKGK